MKNGSQHKVAAANVASSRGVLVLGMHRSGTSAVARVLGLGGADLGSRVLAASNGNLAGHWEDAVAVELHDQLLASFGIAWDAPFGLPTDWRTSVAASEAVANIKRYLETDRRRLGLWAIKDPRLCLFASLWREAAVSAGLPTSAVLVLRHPAEVAASLFARDGIGMLRAQMLWLDYMHAAIEVVERMPHAVVGYPQFLENWRHGVERIVALPGGESLGFEGEAELRVEDFLDPGQRHHSPSAADLLPPVAKVWRLLSRAIDTGHIGSGMGAKVASYVAPLRAMLGPLLAEARLSERRLWERTARAEASVAEDAMQGRTADRLDDFAERLDQRHQNLVSIYSNDIRRMQDVAAQATARAEAAEGALETAKAERLMPLREQMAALEQRMIVLYSNDIRRMQDVAAQATARAEAAEGALEAAKAERLMPLREQISDLQRQTVTQLEVLRSDLHATALRNEALQQELARVSGELAEATSILDQRDRVLVGLRHELEAAADAGDRQQRMLASLTQEAGQLREQAGVLAQLKASNSWRMTRPLRVARRLLNGEWSNEDSARLRDLLRRSIGRTSLLPDVARKRLVTSTLSDTVVPLSSLPDEAIAPMIALAAPKPGLADVFIWSVIDWRFRTQRPQHLAKALADKGHRVFYMSNNFVDDPLPGFRIDPLDTDGRLFQLHLNLAHAPAIYYAMPDSAQVEALRASLAKVLAWSCTTASVSLVHHPYWSPLVRAVPNARLVYDCMDHHAGFLDNARDILEAEQALIRDADIVVVSSSWLEEELAPLARATALVRNAGEFRAFREAPSERFLDPDGRRVIGYYGAIAEWFDADLVRAVARRFPDALLVLAGSDTGKVGKALADLENVRMVGEVPYGELPYWLHGFNVCLLPFKVIPLTLATNPVKVYEYLAAGKPVVSVDLPEMSQFTGLVRTAGDAKGFLDATADALAESDGALVRARQAFAATQTWEARADAFDLAIASIAEPLVSVVVLTYNNLSFTQACLFSLETYSDYQALEIIVVDNASSDGSGDWLRGWAGEISKAGHVRRLILNKTNCGFSSGNNIGLRAASGDVLVVLNNDTYVTPGWVRTLCAHFRQRQDLGLLGPVTNNIGNEARIEIAYNDMGGMIAAASSYTRAHPGQTFPLHNAAFFCVAMPRQVFEQVGELDEAFGIGFFEDDDFCRRVEHAGYKVACAEDVFIHHHLSASFDQLDGGVKQELFERNKAIYEAKWGKWCPHQYRDVSARTPGPGA